MRLQVRTVCQCILQQACSRLQKQFALLGCFAERVQQQPRLVHGTPECSCRFLRSGGRGGEQFSKRQLMLTLCTDFGRFTGGKARRDAGHALRGRVHGVTRASRSG